MSRHFSTRYTIEYLEAIKEEDARKQENNHKTSYFTVRFPNIIKIVYGTAAGIMLAIGLFFQIRLGTSYLGHAILFYSLSGCALFFLLFHLSFRCDVDEEKITQKLFWIHTKTVEWKQVKYKKVLMPNPYQKSNLFLYNSKRKCLIDFTSNMVGFTNIERLTRRKSIPPLPKRK